MKSRVFIKNSNNEFKQKISLLENRMSTINQKFIVFKFFPNLYKIKTVGINTLLDKNHDRQKIHKQRNEFDMYRVVELMKMQNLEN